jgi:hypothetical protein
MSVNILCIGDVVGKPGRGMLADHLPELIRKYDLELVVCNAENAAGGSGLTPQIFQKLLHYGVDVVTLGDHVYRKVEIAQAMAQSDRIVRPVNLLSAAAGKPWTVVNTKSGRHRVAVMCALGQMFMGNHNSPWPAVEQALQEMPEDVRIRVLDWHAEATSEKIAMGWFLNGRASIVFGTHTHVPTADARVLGGGTAYISDVGMTGPYDSVLGRRKDRVLQHLTTSMPHRFDVAQGDERLCGLLATVDESTGCATAVERLEVRGRTDGESAGEDDQDRSAS